MEHLCALSKLLKVHMEEILVLQGEPVMYNVIDLPDNPMAKRLLLYANCIQMVA